MRFALTLSLSVVLATGSAIAPASPVVSSLAGLGIGTAHAAEPSTAGAGAAFPVCSVPPKIDNDLAGSAYKTGRDFFEKGVFNKALERFLEAYESDCTKHEVLIIISRSYESMANYRDAIRALRTLFERKGKDLEDRAALDKRVASLEIQLNKQEAEQAQAAVLEAERKRREKPKVAESRSSAPSILLIGGTALIGLGAVSHVIGIASVPQSCDTFGTNCDDPAQVQNGGTATLFRNVGWGLLGAGVAFAGTGLIWTLARGGSSESTPKPAQASARVSPAFAPGYSGITLHGAF